MDQRNIALPDSADKGWNSVKRYYSDGTLKKVYRYWFGIPIFGEPGSEEYNLCLAEAIVKKHRKLSGKTVTDLVEQFKKALDGYLRVKKGSRTPYRRAFPVILDQWGDLEIEALEDRKTKPLMLEWRDDLVELNTVATAHVIFTRFARILSWALKRGIIQINPCADVEQIYFPEGRDVIWSEDQEELFLRQCASHWVLAYMLAVYTGQREGDLIGLKWANYDGEYIRLAQQKRRLNAKPKMVAIRVVGPLKARLDAADPLNNWVPKEERDRKSILLNSQGKPWTWAANFSTMFGRERRGLTIPVEGVTFHDLRRTAVVRLARAGCTEPEIIAITGHSASAVKSILYRHYLHRDQVVADNAIDKYEALIERQRGEKHRTGLLVPPGTRSLPSNKLPT